MIAEILALCIRHNKEIEGITFRDIRNLLNQFADDMDIFSINSEKSIRAILEELDKFKYQSGFTVSYDKTTLYRIGSLRHSSAQLYNMSQYSWSNQDINVLGVVIAHEDIVQKNYEPILGKVQSVLKSWQNRGISLLAKVQVVNTMVASLFVYKMMVLPIIPDNVVKKCQAMIREYIWGGKKSKIAYNILQNSKENGGLRLVNLRNKDIALKSTWPQILDTEQHYASLVYQILRCSKLKENIWRCSIHPTDVSLLKIREPFWSDVLKSWSEYNYYHNRRIENQYIWYNSNIKVAGKMIMWADCYVKGLTYVHQLFEDQEFKSYDVVMDEFGLSKLRYNSLKVAVPKTWKTFFENTPKTCYHPIPPHTYDLAIHVYGSTFSRRVYDYMLDDAMIIHRKYIKWRTCLGASYDDSLLEFSNRFKHIYQCTNIAKYRSFQYRILQRAIVTNIHLEKWNILQTSNCTFCGQEPESLIHLFCTCPYIHDLWTQIKGFLSEKCRGKRIELSPTTIVMNSLTTPPRHIVNFICIIVKQYIYCQRCFKKSVTFNDVRSKILHVERVEKYIAMRNDKMHIHERKWGTYRSNEANVKNALQNYIHGYINQNMNV